ncbi:hypothetical protein BLA60_28235 [Actinophytocola xinjiangensis]|uniref:Uncharacterized protein n=1 Tax=Actinophytocola xinjiangensis TaxID=485602 RepID=A0A7Z0WKG5_9PSEU|nr:hypothetical protein [Actinophytocola xinjiangensis]OLF07110.1 hypothetical protein BLA60_28235 [Actinophytocola xinjiangensis]
MPYLLAAIGAICIAVLLWRAFVSNATETNRPEQGERRPLRPTRPSRPAPLAPDDDPEFLRSLSERKPPADPDGKQQPPA